MCMAEVAQRLVEISETYGLLIEICAVASDLEHLGIGHAKYIDGELIEKIV